MVGGLPASHKECSSFCKLFLILFLLILFVEKFTCPSRIIDSMAKDRRFFVLTYFCFSALSELSRSLVIPAVAFTTEAYQFWDLLSALFAHPGMLLLQKISLFNLGVHISPQFCWISNFSCNFLVLSNFSGSYD